MFVNKTNIHVLLICSTCNVFKNFNPNVVLLTVELTNDCIRLINIWFIVTKVTPSN